MIWKKPEPYQIRERRIFPLLPKTLWDIRVWFSWVTVKEQWVKNKKGKWKWEAVEFVLEDNEDDVQR